MKVATKFAPIVAVQSIKMFGQISDELILKYDSQVPRYTSYPTAPHFSTQINHNIYQEWLRDLPANESLSLYFHIPFCQQMCWYCGCYTKATQRYEPVANYAKILAREVELVGKLLRQKNQQVLHLHFGGGSPTILLASDFEFLISVIKKNFSISSKAEIAIEVDPRNIDETKVSAYAKAGINRVSIGVQDFNHEVQQAINRLQSFSLVLDSVNLFKKHGIKNINLDLIYGLPKQTRSMMQKNIELALLIKPSRIALFAYAHVQWKKKHMRLIDENDLPNGLTRICMYREAAQKLAAAGYVSIGLDHFATLQDSMFQAAANEKLKRNFQGYSTDFANSLIGFGASAISLLPKGYAQNTLDFDEYQKNILNQNLATAKGVAISSEDQIRKKIIDEIMCYLEVDLNQICQEFALPQNYFDPEISSLLQLEKDGLVRLKNNKIKINLAAPQICRVVATKFDKFFEANTKMHSRVA